MLKRAQEHGLVAIELVDLRQFGKGRYRHVDDRPYGGGPGMVLQAEPVVAALASVQRSSSHRIYLTPQGAPLRAQRCRELAQLTELVILCGHYEGIDERVLEEQIDEEISIGDFVLTSGAPAAIVLVDAVSRFIPGVIGNAEGVALDSFEDGLLDAPVYTRPALFQGKKVPEVLLQGNHAEIARWRTEKRREKTARVRPDLAHALEKLNNRGEGYHEP